jgi:hypothetical protein
MQLGASLIILQTSVLQQIACLPYFVPFVLFVDSFFPE